MKNFIILLICFFSLAAFSQEYKCGWYGKKTVEERNRILPFNKTKRMVLIAYGNHELQYPELELHDAFTLEEAKAIDPNILRKCEFTLEGRSKVYFITEEVELSDKWKNQLSHILCNYTLEKKPRGPLQMSGTMCYFPRNSVLFFDEKDDIICCFEICFECDGTFMWPDPERLDQYADVQECDARLDEIKRVFRENGIVYGVNK